MKRTLFANVAYMFRSQCIPHFSVMSSLSRCPPLSLTICTTLNPYIGLFVNLCARSHVVRCLGIFLHHVYLHLHVYLSSVLFFSLCLSLSLVCHLLAPVQVPLTRQTRSRRHWRTPTTQDAYTKRSVENNRGRNGDSKNDANLCRQGPVHGGKIEKHP